MLYDLFKVIKGDLTEITSDILDAEIDKLIGNEVLKDIPYFGIGFKILSISQKISERTFLKKITKFLFELRGISQHERKEFLKELENEQTNSKAGEQLLILINRLDDESKATIIGKIFKATIEKKLHYSDFIRLTYTVEKTFIDDLIAFGKNRYLLSTQSKMALYQVGLFTQSLKTDNRNIDEQKRWLKNNGLAKSTLKQNPPEIRYTLNGLGAQLAEFGF